MILGIIGLGLIGGSIAKAVRGFLGCTIYGFDCQEEVLDQAKREQVIDQGYQTMEQVQCCDLVVFAVNAAEEKQLVETCAFKANAVVTDVCGIKNFLDELPLELDFVAGHPMAGKEVGGYQNSDGKLFVGANYILVPRKNTTKRAVLLVKAMAEYMGCGNVFQTTAEHHDQMIAFTSQMPHVLAGCIVNTPYYTGCNGFEGGSLADFTRIACLDEHMWSELFLSNREKLLPVLDAVRQNLTQVMTLMAQNDRQGLTAYLKEARVHREEHE